MALPTPDEVLNKKRSSTLPTPDDIVPSRIQAKQAQNKLKSAGLDVQGITKNISQMAARGEQIKQQEAKQTAAKTNTADDLIAERDAERKSQGVPKPLRNFLSGVDKFFYKNPIGKQITGIGQGALTSTTGLTPEEVGTPSVGSKASKIAGSLVGIAANPAQVPGGMINSPYAAPATTTIAGAVGSRIANPAASRIATEATREAIAGVPVSVGQSLMTGESSPRQLVESAALGAGLGAAGGAALRGAGEFIQGAAGRLRTANRAATTADIGGETTASLTTERTIPTPQEVKAKASPQVGERSFIQTLEQSDKLTPETRQGLAQSTERTYEPITNADTIAKANQRIANNIDEAESFVLNGTGRTNAEKIATGMRLIDEFQKSGQTQRAVTLAENLANKLTEAGQTVQAASIWNRLTPEGALLAAQRKVNAINENLNKFQEPVKLTAKDADNITQAAGAIQAAGASQERAGAVIDIMNRAKNGEEITPEERQTVADFIADAKRFVKTENKVIRDVAEPKELKNTRVRDRVVQYLDEQEQAARQRIAARRNTLSANPLDVWADYAIIGASKLAKGTRKFADWSEQMVSEFGDTIRPHLANIFEKSREVLNANSKKINDQVISKAERIAESYLKSNESKLSPEDIDFVRNLAQKVSSLSGTAQREASQDLQAILNGFEKVGIGRKLSSLQYLTMLLNPKTQIRNIVGNELMYRLERLSRVLATPIDIAVSKVTGGPRTITFKRGPEVWSNFFTPTKDYIQGLVAGSKAGWRGVNPEGIQTKYDIGGPAFRSKLNPLTYLEKTLGATLKGFDYASYNRAVQQRLNEMAYLDAINNGVKGIENIKNHMQTYLTNLDDNLSAIAKKYGDYVTLQDASFLSRKLSGFKRGLNQLTTGSPEFGAGNLIVPFAKTPANIFMRALDYSPAGILKAAGQIYQTIAKKDTDLTRADVIESVSRALFGTGIGALAWWLADKGVVRGQASKDKDVRNLENQLGLKEFQLNASALQRMMNAVVSGNMQDIDEAAKLQPGDMQWTYSWAQPASVPIAIGSNIAQSTKEGSSGLHTTVEGVWSGLNTILDTSVLSGIQQAFQTNPGEDNTVKAIAQNLVKQVPSMFTPAILNQINQMIDNKVRETYSPDYMQALLNPSQSKIPGLAQELPQRVGTFGQGLTRPSDFFDVFFNPAERTKYEPTPEARFVIDLLKETGDERVAPRTAPKTISGKDIATGQTKKVKLTGEQYTRLQSIIGQDLAQRINKINPNLPTDKKIQAVIKALDESGKKGRNVLKSELGIRKER